MTEDLRALLAGGGVTVVAGLVGGFVARQLARASKTMGDVPLMREKLHSLEHSVTRLARDVDRLERETRDTLKTQGRNEHRLDEAERDINNLGAKIRNALPPSP